MRHPQVWLRVKKMEGSYEPIVLVEVSRQIVFAVNRFYCDRAGVSVMDLLTVALGFHPVACRQMERWYAEYVMPWPQVRVPSLKINFTPNDDDPLEIAEETPLLDDEEVWQDGEESDDEEATP